MFSLKSLALIFVMFSVFRLFFDLIEFYFGMSIAIIANGFMIVSIMLWDYLTEPAGK
jgi:hypothetical protein